MTMTRDTTDLSSALEALDLTARLRLVAERFPGRVAFSTSLGQEDQVITDAIWRHDVPIRVFTLDTGRLFEATYALIDEMGRKYGRGIEIYVPATSDVEGLVNAKGMHSFYDSVDNRKECCHIRKVRPLQRALQGVDVWVTGLRRGQSSNRQDMRIIEWDESYGLLKLNPLIEWTSEAMLEYLVVHGVPDNPLHVRGFASIGCEPCTRAIAPGEDPRAGRWWWETSKKECGLHR